MMKPQRCAEPQAGFTLIEVLIALTIVSIALAAFIRMTSQTTSNDGMLEQRSLAMLSAENSLAERQLDKARSATEIVDCPQANQRFICRVRSEPVQQGLRLVTVEVFAARGSDQKVLTLQTQLPESSP